ncbi:GerMN domain-containing protein [Kocuria sp.]|uniref:GerMN domain-containing protein n=1 Tax=Kocuria sp. TaxID=1871328 RepID=UPI0026DF9D49|nr:GerMN domain-containing protein [Kocuria sp.]MDO5617699.1 GerMN domain-containing protein [Kocuria sp.]
MPRSIKHHTPGQRGVRTAVGVGLATVLTLVACSPSNGSVQPSAADTVNLDSPSTGTAQAAESTVTVYWVAAGNTDHQLVRDSVRVSSSTTADPIESAVLAMTQTRPADTAQSTLWTPVTRVGTSFTRGVITVDLPSSVVARHLDADRAELATQQLVHTVVAAAQDSGLLSTEAQPTVRILIDGTPQQEIFGSYTLPEKITADTAAL